MNGTRVNHRRPSEKSQKSIENCNKFLGISKKIDRARAEKRRRPTHASEIAQPAKLLKSNTGGGSFC